MKVGLLDVNMLIAMSWPSHIHHQAAHSWFAKNASHGWATCPMTQCAFLRISANPKIIQEAVEPREALDILKQITNQKHHVFWPDNISVNDPCVPGKLLAGHRQITDAYLFGLAIKHGGKLVTLDKGIADLIHAGSSDRNALELVVY